MDIKGFKDTINWYDENAEVYSISLYTVTPTESINKFLEHLSENPYILEAGCGPGRESKVFIERGAKIVGVDLSEGLLKIAKEKNPSAEFIKANFLSLPFDANTFDGVWAHASLVHLETIEDVKQALSEFSRVLKSDGVMYVSVKAQMGGDKTAVVSDTLSKHERFFRYYTQEELNTLITDEGFKILETEITDDHHGRADTKWIESIAQKSL